MSTKTEFTRDNAIKRGPVFSPIRVELVDRLTREADTLTQDAKSVVLQDRGQKKRMAA